MLMMVMELFAIFRRLKKAASDTEAQKFRLMSFGFSGHAVR